MLCRSLFVPLSIFGHCVVCPSLIYGFWLPFGIIKLFLCLLCLHSLLCFLCIMLSIPYCSSVFSRAYILLLSLNSNTITLFCNRNVTSIGNKSRKRDTSSFQLLHSIRFVVITYQLTILCSDCPVVHHFKIQVNIGRKLVGLDTWVNCIFITPTLINYSIHGNDIRKLIIGDNAIYF